MDKMLDKRMFWLLLAVCALTLLPYLGFSDYHTKGEPRESVVAQAMLSDGNWILSRNNGGEMAYKPPFFHWCVAAASLVRGEVTEGASRLPSAIALILMTLGVFVFYARRRATELALLTAFVAFTSFELHRAGANCRVDMVLTAATVGALLSLYSWYERGMRGVPLVAIVLMAVGTLTKGPVGSIIPCLVMGLFLLLRGVNFFRAFALMVAWGVLSLLPYAVWFWAAYAQGGQEFLDLMYEENIGRMTSTMSYESCVNPWWYNFVTLLGGYIPWNLLLVVSLFFLSYKGLKRPASDWACRLWQKVRTMSDVDLYSLVAIVAIFVFYCIPQSKRSVYLMPIYPFIAYFIAKYMLWLADFRPRALRLYAHFLGVLLVVLFVAYLLLRAGLVPDGIFHGKHAADNLRMLRALEGIGSLWQLLLIALSFAVGLMWWLAMRHNRSGRRTVWAIVLMTFALYLPVDMVYTPAVLNTKSVKEIAAEIDRVAPQGEGTLYEYIDAGVKAKGDPVHFFEVNFYLNNRIGNFYKERPLEGFLLISQPDMELCCEEFSQWGYRFSHLYDAPKRKMQVYKFEKDR